MRREREEDDEDEDDSELESKGRSPLVWGLVSFGGVLVVGIFVFLIAFPWQGLFLHDVKQQEPATDHSVSNPATSVPPRPPKWEPPGGKAPDPTKKYYLREELRALLMDKTQEEVLKLLGKPSRTHEGMFDEPTWYYHELTLDPISEKVDYLAEIRFKDGKVVRVSY
ncbi:MAG TPA: outer membrane protein assembly factor BamE [Gemmata sp.]|nr:outer membrane protein assembly factor BamE [Gemmata sp.]